MNLLMEFFGNQVPTFTLVKTLVPTFMAVLFLQSGLDKVVDYRGNLSYLTDHFKNSPLSKTVGFLMPTITFLEVSAGLLSAIGAVSLLFGSEIWAFCGLMTAAAALLCLFFGQRMAKDYAGAVGLSGYFILVVVGLLLLS